MKISYNWLQTYFDEKLPAPRELAELFTMYAFEVESVDEVLPAIDGARRIHSDFVFDIKILPNRAHDCLSHRGIAREIGTLLGRKLKVTPRKESADFKSEALTVDIADKNLCTRYSSAIIRGVSVKESPAWLVEKIEAIGQKSINNIVDATNYVMFALGQPLHAFDLAKLIEKNNSYAILVRNSKEGEKMDALDGKTYELPQDTLVITDKNCKDNKILGIAGIKGGTVASIDENTTNILLESANFDSIKIRTTSKFLGLRTDASVRFENGITPEITVEALQDVCELIVNIAEGSIEALVDVRVDQKPQHTIKFTFKDIENVLGFAITHKKIIQILKHLGCVLEMLDDTLLVTVPYERLDLVIKEDLIEEVGRVYGFFNVPPLEPKDTIGAFANVTPNKTVVYTDVIRSILIENGFSEVYTYSFRNSGERELQNPIASDKKFLRENLAEGLLQSLDLNLYNAPLLKLYDFVKIFEIGKVFTSKGENLSLGISIASVKKIKNADATILKMLEDISHTIAEQIGFKGKIKANKSTNTLEFDLDEIVELLPEKNIDNTHFVNQQIKYKKISQYPFALRDIAVFVPNEVGADFVEDLISREAGKLLTSISLFDVFNKNFEDGTKKTSFAYNLVFQSDERTLDDQEINEVMKKVTNILNAQSGWRVR